MNIAGLIGIAIAIVVGVSLVPTVVDTVNNLCRTGPRATPQTVLNLADLLPIVFIAILIIGAVGFIAYAVAAR